MEPVKTRRAFQRGKQPKGSNQCVSLPDSSFFAKTPRVHKVREIYPKRMVRLHCLRYGKYFSLKEKCLSCGYLISFTQEVR